MKCDKEYVTHFLNNQLKGSGRKEFETHLAGCTACQQELKEALEVLTMMKQIQVPEPSADMEMRFRGMLDAYKESVINKESIWKNFIGRLQQLWSLQPKFQLAYSITLLILGITVGYLFLGRNSKDNSKEQIATLSSKVEDMRQILMMSMLENPSASERLKAVSYTEEITNVNNEVINALFATLNEDPNVNVRLVTLDALTRYSSNPNVRKGLIQSIVQQESPLVQSALADVMLKLREKRSVESFKALLQKKEVNNPVRIKIEQVINTLTI